MELRYAEAGRHQVCSVKSGEVRDCLQGSHSARTRVHEYGLGAIEASADTLFYSNDADSAVYAINRTDASATPRRLTLPDTKRRFADLEFSPQVFPSYFQLIFLIIYSNAFYVFVAHTSTQLIIF